MCPEAPEERTAACCLWPDICPPPPPTHPHLLQAIAFAASTVHQSLDAGLFPADVCHTVGLLAKLAATVPGGTVHLGSHTGAGYSAGLLGVVLPALLATTAADGGDTVQRVALLWPEYPATVPAASRQGWKARCLTERPVILQRGRSCVFPDCAADCGYDPRCQPWYAVQAGAAGFSQQLLSEVYTDLRSGAYVAAVAMAVRNTEDAVCSAVWGWRGWAAAVLFRSFGSLLNTACEQGDKRREAGWVDRTQTKGLDSAGLEGGTRMGRGKGCGGGICILI